MDDIGIAANNATDLTRNIRAVFQCIRNVGLKLTIEKCHFGVRQVEFLGRTNSSEGVSPQAHKIQNFQKKTEIPQIEKGFTAVSGLRKLLQKLHSQNGRKVQSFLQTLENRSPNQHYIRTESNL